ncbi:MAG: hypothetical protein HY823_04065 [Acidobacteria bacterium]|nr:hypothetical protein [Acidobacteriota bacterium]
MRRSTLPLLAAAICFALALPVNAKMPFVKKAQELGFKDIKNCASCHKEAMPKAAAKGEPYGEVGQFLLDTKAKKKAAEVDLAWLKDYKPKAQ